MTCPSSDLGSHGLGSHGLGFGASNTPALPPTTPEPIGPQPGPLDDAPARAEYQPTAASVHRRCPLAATATTPPDSMLASPTPVGFPITWRTSQTRPKGVGETLTALGRLAPIDASSMKKAKWSGFAACCGRWALFQHAASRVSPMHRSSRRRSFFSYLPSSAEAVDPARARRYSAGREVLRRASADRRAAQPRVGRIAPRSPSMVTPLLRGPSFEMGSEQ